MLRTASRNDGVSLGSPNLSPEIQAVIKAELESMLKAPIFAQSGRCKRFLSHVVVETLSGNAAELKERTIGISVFNRANDYETGDDSIVRVTANEVRKRLGQFYGESKDAHSIQIELPRGSYVPEFRIQPSKAGRNANELVAQNDSASSTSGEGPLESQPEHGPDGTAARPVAVMEPGILAKPEIISNRPRTALWVAIGIVILGAAIFGLWRINNAIRVPDIWGSFLNANSPVLVCIDTHDLHVKSTVTPNDQTFVNAVLYKQIISLDDAAVLSTMTSLLGKKGVLFRVAGADATSLTEFRRQPVILIGAIDNKWTLRLTEALRYRIEVANPPGSGAGKEPIATIVDSQNPSDSSWRTDLSIPFSAWKNDYAIVARVDDSTTGVPVLIEAGLGNTGSIAASELILSGKLSDALAIEPGCRNKRNFEAVVETQILETKPGPPHILRLACW